jgi:hypothetical protein
LTGPPSHRTVATPAQTLQASAPDNWRYRVIRLTARNAQAISHCEHRIALLRTLYTVAPNGSDIGIELGQGLLNLGELRVLTGDLEAFRQSLALRRALAESGLGSPQRLTELAWSQARLAQFGDTPRQRWREVERLLIEADTSEPLGDLEEELLTVARITLSAADPHATNRHQAQDGFPVSDGAVAQ